MLFNSTGFIFVFLPLALGAFLALLRFDRSGSASRLALLAASLFFYGSWRLPYLFLLVLSIVFNYQTARSLHAIVERGEVGAAKRLLAARITINLLLLGYFKYLGFAAQIVNGIFGTHWSVDLPVLPLGVSFYTFTEIAFLVDIYRRITVPGSVREYALFVTFFPHLVAGPIVHYRHLTPQFAVERTTEQRARDIMLGMSLFSAGLFKKVVIADHLSTYCKAVFDQGLVAGVPLTFFPAWAAALAYAFQLYFDFSGYSDMAIGLARMFGIKFPQNFNSPYKATSIIEFWRRWHMTLSDFLRDYVYIPLGGNRRGPGRRYLNLLLTMLIGGLWHGAGWTFVVWGALHGGYLVLNHLWRALVTGRGGVRRQPRPWTTAVRCGATFCAVVVAWVFFRAHTCGQAVQLLMSMAGWHGIVVPPVALAKLGRLGPLLMAAGIRFEPLTLLYWSGVWEMASLFIVGVIAVAAPNTCQIFLDEDSAGNVRWYQWRATRSWALLTGIVFMISVVVMTTNRAHEFLYFNF